MEEDFPMFPTFGDSGDTASRAYHKPSRQDLGFNPLMLTAAREAMPVTQTELAQQLSVSQPLIAKWENTGPSGGRPSVSQLAALGDALEVHPDLFFADRSGRLATMAEFYHRAFSAAKGKSVKAAHARCCLIELRVDRLLNLCPSSEDRIPDVDPDNHANDIEKVAGIARVRMGLPPGPVENLVDTIETCGGLVIDKGFDIDGVDALCRWVPGLPKLFYVNGSAPGDRMRTTLAHELGHTVMHLSRDVSVDLAEDQARRFAAAFLLPASEIQRDLGAKVDLEKLAALKRKWRVSMQAIAYRAHQLGSIDQTRYTSIFQQLSKMGWRKTEPVLIRRESPHAFKRLLSAHLRAGYTRDSLARLLLAVPKCVDGWLVDAASPDWQTDGVRMRIAR